MKYLIVEEDTIFIPGDERSRTNPGHGYPEHTEKVQRVKEFDDIESLQAYLNRWYTGNPYRRKTFKVYSAKEIKAEFELSIKLS